MPSLHIAMRLLCPVLVPIFRSITRPVYCTYESQSNIYTAIDCWRQKIFRMYVRAHSSLPSSLLVLKTNSFKLVE